MRYAMVAALGAMSALISAAQEPPELKRLRPPMDVVTAPPVVLTDPGPIVSTSMPIIGGTRAQLANWPGAASLQLRDTRAGEPKVYHICGATMIAPDWALTAAHCLIDIEARSDGVWLMEPGANGVREATAALTLAPMRTGTLTDAENAAIDVIAIQVHPRFDPRTPEKGHDIALVQINASWSGGLMKMDGQSGAAMNIKAPEAILKIAGFGHVRPAGSRLERGAAPGGGSLLSPYLFLMEGEVPLVPAGPPLRTCDTQIANAIIEDGLSETLRGVRIDPVRQICAGDARIDACQGDSGGPMISPRADGTPVQVGIVSWGLGCADANRPGIYTRVAAYKWWIRITTGIFEF